MRGFLLVFILTSLACSRGAAPAEPPIRADDASVPVVSASAPEPSAPPPIVTVHTSCSKDSDCSWDDPCMATRCQGPPKTPYFGCDKSRLPPGSCLCVDGTCTTKRALPVAATVACSAAALCAFDASTGLCRVGTESAASTVNEGGICTCNSGKCELDWVERVPCTSSADCSWLEHPRRPVASSKVPRPHPPIKPCAGGEWDSVCTAGQCRITAWKC
jgi:hypothetical protein